MKNRFLIILILLLHCSSCFSQYISLDNDIFVLNNNRFTPYSLNYLINFNYDSLSNDLWISANHCYWNSNNIECSTAADCLNLIKDDFILIKDAGFNTIRLMNLDPFDSTDNNLYIKIFKKNNTIESFIDFNSIQEQYYNTVEDIINITDSIGLKLIIQIQGPINNNIPRRNFIIEFLCRYQNKPSIFAYDFYNEPEWFNKNIENKAQALQVVRSWKNLITTHAPHHLLTIGFATSFEAFCWDYNILPVDFASFHPYGTIDRFKDETFYIHSHINKPWIIGETGLSTNSTNSYQSQSTFLNKTIDQSFNCNSLGYSWWQYKDVFWGDSIEDHFGLIAHSPNYIQNSNGDSIQGEKKTAFTNFIYFISNRSELNCECSPYFYNRDNYNKHIIRGQLIDATSQLPINSGLVKGWYLNGEGMYEKEYRAYTNNNGEFNLYSDKEVSGIMFSAPGYETTISYNIDTIKTNKIISNRVILSNQALEENISGKIILDNVVINGNTFVGGNAILFSSEEIQISNTNIKKGATFIAQPKRNLGNIILNRFSNND